MGIPNEFGVLLGNGSDELIQLLALACDTSDTILSVEPSFVMYGMIAKFTRLNYQGVDLNDDFEIDLNAMLHSIETHQPKLIFIAYPNNPLRMIWAFLLISSFSRNRKFALTCVSILML
jgi:histidinol-phosphate aminotransferase